MAAGRGVGALPPRLSLGRKPGGRLPARQQLLCGRGGPVGRAGGSVGPAAARYVRAQGLRAGMTDRERDIPGGGGAGAALPWSRCQRRRLPETWRARAAFGEREAVREGRYRGAGGASGAARACFPRWSTPPRGTRGSDGGAKGRGANPAFPLPARCVRAGELRESPPPRPPSVAPARRRPRRRALPL